MTFSLFSSNAFPPSLNLSHNLQQSATAAAMRRAASGKSGGTSGNLCPLSLSRSDGHRSVGGDPLTAKVAEVRESACEPRDAPATGRCGGDHHHRGESDVHLPFMSTDEERARANERGRFVLVSLAN